jgi:hypothetical protein
MKSIIRIFRAAYFVVISLSLLSCSAPQEIKQGATEQIIEMSSYTVAVPSGGTWKVEADKANDKVRFTNQPESVFGGGLPITAIHVSSNWVAKKEMWKLSPEEIANDYREGERANMMMRGVLPGSYELYDVKKDTSTVDGKTLYTLSYKQTGGKWFGKDKINESVLYLYFPTNFHESHKFYLFHISQANMRDAQGAADLSPIFPVIKSFRLK